MFFWFDLSMLSSHVRHYINVSFFHINKPQQCVKAFSRGGAKIILVVEKYKLKGLERELLSLELN